MQFDERNIGDYRVYAGALEGPQGDGYIAALIVQRVHAYLHRVRRCATKAWPAGTAGSQRTRHLPMPSARRRTRSTATRRC